MYIKLECLHNFHVRKIHRLLYNTIVSLISLLRKHGIQRREKARERRKERRGRGIAWRLGDLRLLNFVTQL